MAHSSTSFRERPLEERFWEKVQIGAPDECWPWLGARRPSGHGTIRCGDQTRSAAQVAWELENNQGWPEGMDSCHSCDNPPCVNPDHIWPGTRLENVRDMLAKNRAGGFARANADKSHCVNGHELSGDNLRTYFRDGIRRRACRACQRTHANRNRAKAALASQLPEPEKQQR